MVTHKIIAVAALAALPFFANAQDDINAILKKWSVITSGDLKSVNDIQGAAYVGGNVTVSQSFVVGKDKSLSSSDISLAVRGNIVSGGDIHSEYGSVVVGGSVNGRNIGFNHGGTLTTENTSALPASPVAAVTSASQLWSTFSANSTTTVDSAGKLCFNCSEGFSVAVFTISASAFASDHDHGFDLTFADSTKDVIINIDGSTWNMDAEHFFGDFKTEATHVIFNFYNATSINLTDAIYGYVIAPNADVNQSNNFNGGVMAKMLTIGSEANLVNWKSWEGNVPNVTAVPETSTWVAGAFASVALAFGLFRSRLTRKLVVK